MARTGIHPWLRGQARALRREPTHAERRLWRALQRLNRQGTAHFRRQAPIGGYVVDFADLGRRLVIEVDGGQHGGEADGVRHAWPILEGFLVLRFRDNDVLGNTSGVVETVTRTLAKRPHPHPIPPPQGGREPPGAEARHTPAGGEHGDGPGASPPPCGEGMGVGRRRRRPSRKGD